MVYFGTEATLDRLIRAEGGRVSVTWIAGQVGVRAVGTKARKSVADD